MLIVVVMLLIALVLNKVGLSVVDVPFIFRLALGSADSLEHTMIPYISQMLITITSYGG